MPKDLREMLPAAQRQAQRLERPSPEVLERAFQMFWSALGPLREAGKLAMITCQFPPYFTARPSNFARLASLPERLPGASIAIEFRHPSWVRDSAQSDQTMKFLCSHGLYYTSIDAPEDPAIVPSFIAATGDQAYVRFHGKNREHWFARNVTAAERFKYLYSERELQTLGQGFVKLGESGVRRAFAVFNNCYENFGVMNATTMAEIPRDSEEREASVLARSNHPADLYRSPHEIDDSHQQYATRIIEHAEELVGALRCVHSGRAIFAEQLHFRRHP
jgi:uncharacterized protein YecE (DUF72 family)